MVNLSHACVQMAYLGALLAVCAVIFSVYTAQLRTSLDDRERRSVLGFSLFLFGIFVLTLAQFTLTLAVLS